MNRAIGEMIADQHLQELIDALDNIEEELNILKREEGINVSQINSVIRRVADYLWELRLGK